MKSFNSLSKLAITFITLGSASIALSGSLTEHKAGPVHIPLQTNQELQIGMKSDFKKDDGEIHTTRLSDIYLCIINPKLYKKMHDPLTPKHLKPRSYCERSVSFATSAFITYNDKSINNSICKMALGDEFTGEAKGYINFNQTLKNTFIYTSIKASADQPPFMNVVYLQPGMNANPIHTVDCVQNN